MVGGVGGDGDDFPVEGTDQGRILPLRVDDDHIAVPSGGQLEHLGLRIHRFARAGDTQHQAVAVLELPPVDEDQVAGDLVPAAVVASGMLYALRPKRHEGRRVLRGHGPQGVDAPKAVRQGRVHALPLPVFQDLELAAVLPARGDQRGGVPIQLLLAVGQVDQRHGYELQLLVILGQLLQQLLGGLLLLLDVVGKCGGPVQVLILLLGPLRRVGGDAQQDIVDLLHRFAGGNGDEVNGQHEVPAQVAHLSDHGILQNGGIVLQVQHPPIPLSDPNVVRLIGKERRRDHIQKGMASAHEGLHVEMEMLLLTGMEEVIEHPQPLLSVQIYTLGIEGIQSRLEVGGDGVVVPGNIVMLVVEGGHGGVDGMGDPVPHLGICQEDVVSSLNQRVQVVSSQGDQVVPDRSLGLGPVEYGDLGGGPRLLAVQQLLIGFVHTLLRVQGRHGVVHIRELIGLGILLLPDLEDTVLPQPLDGDGVLNGARHPIGFLLPFLVRLQCLNQPSIPPYTCCPCSGPRRRDCTNGRRGTWA